MRVFRQFQCEVRRTIVARGDWRLYDEQAQTCRR
jgi:hypothetical protein